MACFDLKDLSHAMKNAACDVSKTRVNNRDLSPEPKYIIHIYHTVRVYLYSTPTGDCEWVSHPKVGFYQSIPDSGDISREPPPKDLTISYYPPPPKKKKKT